MFSDERRSPARRGLPTFLRFTDLQQSGLVGSWQQLLRMMDREGFPAGVKLSTNVRAWRLDEVESWLAERSSARKIMPLGARGEHRRKVTAP
jgi:predicted DNA-binding transcriptional regulator AlpA